MAFRAAVNTSGVAGVIAVGGDVPPELAPPALRRLPAALVARGTSDDWYSKDKFAADERRLQECSVNVRTVEFNGGHEWSSEVVEAASRFLRELHP